jgi:glyoxylase-like metal-dependent hydrolase (beta-lactamase superfamily II)
MGSSVLLSASGGRILIDATRDFAAQARRLPGIDLVLLTHAHRDASGGIPSLQGWLAARGCDPDRVRIGRCAIEPEPQSLRPDAAARTPCAPSR